MSTPGQRSGTLTAGQWTKVIWGWGYYKLVYQVFGTGLPVEVRVYGPTYSEFRLEAGGFLTFSPIGYGDIWFKSATGGSYVFVSA